MRFQRSLRGDLLRTGLKAGVPELELAEESLEGDCVGRQLERGSMLHLKKNEAKTAELHLALAHAAQRARRQ